MIYNIKYIYNYFMLIRRINQDYTILQQGRINYYETII